MLLAQGKRSLQLALNEIIPKLGTARRSVSKVAYSKARLKLKHTAFIELNQRAVVDVMYGDGDYETWHGHRILAVDGSKLILPTNEQTIAEFGTTPFDNKGSHPNGAGEHAGALVSILYDVLNRVVLDARLAPIRSYEGDLAASHLAHTTAIDLTIYDRGYASFRMMALSDQANSQFLMRVPKHRFKVATDMLAGRGADDVTINLEVPPSARKAIEDAGLPTVLRVRFVRVVLDDGTIEVLATSLLDQTAYPLSDFKQLYYMRWGIETFYGILKTRLGLENFSGVSPEAIRQDFFATIFLTGSETLLTMDAEDHLSKQVAGHPKKVNKAVSFNQIKYRAFELYYSKLPQDKILQELTELFTTSPTLVRAGRNPPRKKPSSHRILGFWKRTRKEVF